ncbi:MAG: acyl-CoA/acyl-ACP dehydrogenase [Mangrovicoccus sp.]|nr:acyl-CoA/acyl-ACP dehydrogenase [Mangrovicoccus sp.]
MSMEILTEDQQMVRDAAAGFLSASANVDSLRQRRNATQGGRGAHDPALLQAMAELGWYGILLPEDQGGVDLGARAAGLIAQEAGRNLSPLPFLGSAVLAAAVLRDCEDQDWAAKLASGEIQIAFAFEEGGKHAPDHVAMQALAMGNSYNLSGAKRHVADLTGADFVITTAQSDQGLGLFLLATQGTGVQIDPLATVDSGNYAHLQLDHAQAEAVLAIGERAETVLANALRVGRAVAAAELLGLADEAATRTSAYLKERKQFGMTLASFQALQHRAADLYCQIESTRAVVAAALDAIDQADPQAESLSRVAKAKATKTARLAVSEAVQMHGGIGMTDALDIGLFMKKARAAAEILGDHNHHSEWLLQQKGL